MQSKNSNFLPAGPRGLSHQAAVIKIQPPTRWSGTRITCATNARRPTMVVKLDATHSWGESHLILRSWCAADVATWQGLRCVRSMGQTSSSINADTVVRWRSSSASGPRTSANLATTTFSELPPSPKTNCLCVRLVRMRGAISTQLRR